MSVSLYARTSAAITWRISLKFHIGNLYENLSWNSTFSRNWTKMSGALHLDLSRLYCWWRHYFAKMHLYATLLVLKFFKQWHVAQQYTQNALLCFHLSNGYTNVPRCESSGLFHIKITFQNLAGTHPTVRMREWATSLISLLQMIQLLPWRPSPSFLSWINFTLLHPFKQLLFCASTHVRHTHTQTHIGNDGRASDPHVYI